MVPCTLLSGGKSLHCTSIFYFIKLWPKRDHCLFAIISSPSIESSRASGLYILAEVDGIPHPLEIWNGVSLPHLKSQNEWVVEMVSWVRGLRLSDSYYYSFLVCSGNKTAIVTNTTVEIVVPGDAISSVEGENGSNLAQLREVNNIYTHILCLGSWCWLFITMKWSLIWFHIWLFVKPVPR